MQGPVRWGFVGAGMVAREALAPAVHAADGAVLHAVAARDPDRAAALGPARVHATYDALLADDEVDAVYVSLSNEAHLPWTLAALAAGKSVLCEKPLGLSAAEVDEMARAAGDLLVVEASWYRWHPRVRLAQARLPRSGRCGTSRPASSSTAAWTATTGSTRPAGEGRCTTSAATPCRPACGRPGAGCRRTSSRSRSSARPASTSTAARSCAGPTAPRPRCTPASPAGEGQWLVVTGDDGEIELRDAPYTSWKDDDTELWVSDGTGTERVPVPAVDAYRVMVEEVSSVLSGGPGWVLPLEESRQTAAVLDAAFASARSGGEPVLVA